MNTYMHSATHQVLQVSSFVKRNFILRSNSNQRITFNRVVFASASSSSSHANSNSMEDYNSRWENHWKTGPDGDGLKGGQLFDAMKSSPALDSLIVGGTLDLSEKRVFVPGCGRGYDLVTFVKAGAKEALGLELAPSAVSFFKFENVGREG
jgi:Thiopurine S-methyltransferase (TPMT)